MPTPSTPTFRDGARARNVQTLTDIETVRDIAASGDRVFVATDAGLFVYAAGQVNRLDIPALGMDIRGVTLTSGGAPIVASAAGVFAIEGQSATPIEVPDVGTVMGMERVGEVVYVCGSRGIARGTAGTMSRFGDTTQCLGLFPAAQGALWIGTTRGAWFVDGDVVTEHAEGRGLPAAWVRSIVPMPEGQAFALVQDATESHLAYYDGLRWYGYTIDGFTQPVVGLSRGNGGNIWLFGEGYAFAVDDASRAQGVRLTALSRGERMQTLSYRGESGPATPPREVASLRAPSRLAPIPANHPTFDAPSWVVSPIGAVGDEAYLVRHVGDRAYVADRNRGVLPVGASGPEEALRTRSLVASRDLQVASDSRGDTWLLTEQGVIARAVGSSLRRVDAPEGLAVGALAAASRGLYIAGVVPGNRVQVYRREGDSWTRVIDRAVFEPAQATTAEAAEPTAVDPEAGDTVSATALNLIATPMMGVRDNEECWIALRISASTESGGRLRGVAVISPGDGPIIYHHANADPAVDGEGALRMSDDFGSIDVDQSEMAWFSTVVGAVRIGNHQAVTFGEARGVRGEVVSDVLVGTENKVWVAAAEGPGYYFQQRFEFRMPQAVRDARPIALALDGNGHVWGAGPNGLVRYADENWTLYGDAEGLPVTQFVDIESDASGRLWVLGRDRVLLLGPPAAPPPAE